MEYPVSMLQKLSIGTGVEAKPQVQYPQMTQNGAQFQQVAYAIPTQPMIVQMQFGPNPVSHYFFIISECKPNSILNKYEYLAKMCK